ncbi:MAG: HAMP domain-containing sensor histidine kinase [Polyangiaceae bacterium]
MNAPTRGPWRPDRTRTRQFRPFLQRRIFFAFGFGILLMGVCFALVWTLGERAAGSPWDKERVRVATFVASRFERVWDDVPGRTELLRAMREELDLEVRGTDTVGRGVFATPGACDKPVVTTPVTRNGVVLGQVAVCVNRRMNGGPGRFLLPFGIVAFAMWISAGIVARKLARPLLRIAGVAEEFGRGNLAARVELPHHHRRGEMRVLADVMNDMASRIERQLNDQKALLAAVSHEVRTPLARIRLLVELARSESEDATHLDGIDREVLEIDSLVSELLAGSRIDFAALQETRLDPVDVARRVLEARGISGEVLEVEGADGSHGTLAADATLLHRALVNLVDNAAKHGGGVRRFAVTILPERVRFTVDDRGAGFSAEELTRAFEPFYKGARTGGVGLGLALVRRIAEAHGGSATVSNVDGTAGTHGRVELELPAGREGLHGESSMR